MLYIIWAQTTKYLAQCKMFKKPVRDIMSSNIGIVSLIIYRLKIIIKKHVII
jgi:hypothetical protein